MRWIVFEIFVIPSGSMYPKLYINDYIIVSKFDYGLRLPFTHQWLLGPYLPKRNSTAVFKSPDETKYYVKRLVGLPGDKLIIAGDFILSVNGKRYSHKKYSEKEKRILAENMSISIDSFEAFFEKGEGVFRTILTDPGATSPETWTQEERLLKSESFEPPDGYILFMGDNRHQSYDGRRFGYIEAAKLVGQPRLIGLSCQAEIFEEGCSLSNLRTDRILKRIEI